MDLTTNEIKQLLNILEIFENDCELVGDELSRKAHQKFMVDIKLKLNNELNKN